MQAYSEINVLRFSREPLTGKRAFMRVKPSYETPISRDTMSIPVDIDIYAAEINYLTLFGYACFVLGALAPFLTSRFIPSLAAPFFTIALVGIGAALLAIRPRLFKPGKLLITLHDTIEPQFSSENKEPLAKVLEYR
jgi:hypothetical protein